MPRYMLIIAPDGENCGSTPLNDSLEPTDGSYGLYEWMAEHFPKRMYLEVAEHIEFVLLKLCREDLYGEFMGFKAEVLEDE